MDTIVAIVAPILAAGGPWTAIVAGLVVGLGLLVIVGGKATGLISGARNDLQSTSFQDRLLRQIDRMAETEEALRARLERAEKDGGELRDEIAGLRTTLMLIRAQRRKLLDMLRRQLDPDYRRASEGSRS